jgi:hypothetical protein
VIVWLEEERRHEVHKYDAAGNLLVRLEEVHPVQGLPRPPTATAGPPPTAPTPRWPSATPRPASPTPDGTATPTAVDVRTPTEGDLRTPTPTAGELLFVPFAARLAAPR